MTSFLKSGRKFVNLKVHFLLESELNKFKGMLEPDDDSEDEEYGKVNGALFWASA